jgi:hypothetical protein
MTTKHWKRTKKRVQMLLELNVFQVHDSVVKEAADHELEVYVALTLDLSGERDMLKTKLENCAAELTGWERKVKKIK